VVAGEQRLKRGDRFTAQTSRGRDPDQGRKSQITGIANPGAYKVKKRRKKKKRYGPWRKIGGSRGRGKKKSEKMTGPKNRHPDGEG